MRSLLLFLVLILVPHLALSQARDTTTRPEGIVTLEEFKEAISDGWRTIYVRTISDSLVGPIRSYAGSRFYLEDSTFIDRNVAKGITEYRSCANPGAMYGAIGGIIIGGVISAVLLSNGSDSGNSGDGSQALLGPVILIGGSLSLALPGALIGLIVGGKFERGYNFPVTSLESE